MYDPLAKALTLISLDVCQGDKVIVFVPNATISLRVMDGARDKPDIVGFLVDREDAEQLVVDENHRIRVPSAYEIIVAIECKVKENQLLQGQRYCFAVSRHRHGSPLQFGLVINTKRFRLISISLDNNAFWSDVKWEAQSLEPIRKLYESIRLIWEEASTIRDKRVPVPQYLITLDNGRKRPIAIHSVTLGRRLYYLIPIFSGRGNGRKPFVALAFAAGNPADRLVLKYSWHSDNDHSREWYFLEKLKDAPGVVLIDEALSSDSIQYDEESGRHQNLIALKTIGRSITSAESVLEFLEAIYDLLEILQYHIHERDVLHRDISLGNVLVPVISPFQIPKKEANWDKYQFISDYDDDDDVTGENKPRRVKVALTDFDHAQDLTMATDDLKNATGTPMFMAADVLAPRTKRAMNSIPFDEDDMNLMLIAIGGSGKQYRNGEEAKWDSFYRDLGHIHYVRKKNPEELFRHGAMHDAESVYYLCLLFFCRMVREGEHISDADFGKRQLDRGYAFEGMAKKTAGDRETRPFGDGLPIIGFEREFFNMLSVIETYLVVPWYNVKNTGHGEPFEFHLHELMQRLILKEIRRLRVSSSIPVQVYPIAVKSNIAVYGNFYTFFLSTSGLSMFGASQRPEGNKESTERSSKRPRHDIISDFMKNVRYHSLCRWSTFTEIKAKQLTKDLPEDLVMIVVHKRKEMLWLASDKIGVAKLQDSSHDSS
ncbi:uncharacterized protein FOMMEDRAFT_147462 [Fomitiporia mediterranea MF3/22]|uniref:uncharacterized protein n=1 Tax=Fomitiporia mediterranea (strain MF3/22) TaxID=694068 RepID=UPI00044082F1|nr:uncharacterized protein FOMMEDRAFT_147462 [Fomitiporia mediterranea MF3/22]EJD02523.1 hypothetical protein FOMMEDRAFT_147462 [Fomitiporia mediterranea MF3/22]